MEKAIDKILTKKFIALLDKNVFHNSTDPVICHAQEEFNKTLTTEQIKEVSEIDNLVIEAQTAKMEQAFRLGFLEGLKVGGRILS